MKQILTLITAIIFSASAFPQQTLEIAGENPMERLAYSTVINLSARQAFYADKNGIALIHVKENDSLLITHVGYHDKILQWQTNLTQIKLTRKPELLKNVVVKNCRSWQKQQFSNIVTGEDTNPFGGVSLAADGELIRFGILLARGEQVNSRLSSFSFVTKQGFPWLNKKQVKGLKAPFRFSFYSVSDSSMLPGELLTHQTVMYYPKKTGLQTVSVDSLKLVMPENGIYVMIQYLADPEGLIAGRTMDQDGNESISYSPGLHLDGVRSAGFPLAFYDYREMKWFFPGRISYDPKRVKGSIQFAYELMSCAE